MNINERIQKIVDEMFNGNKAAFSKCIGVKPTTISNIIGRERASKPSSEILESIAYSIPEVNSDWLLTGQGELRKSDEIKIFSNNETPFKETIIKEKTPIEQLIDNNTILVQTNAKLAERILELTEKGVVEGVRGVAPKEALG